ncbi:methyl-accepting chemotaxis protein [Ectobacillus ponti]|uniref:Methyl-accepting chemotaxis protein n=1 Tax=Ectobacillus ponti TaxID=2961894 RepID=A0AA41XC74_9BACI|nr:methyl-accepting chemotaxis protein [Ectobacillus ponti]MCP8970998.1 methyl-accepting chemotaxis protein [Ectobacillus ponti]
MRRTLTWQLGSIIVGVILASLLIMSLSMYKTAYDKIYEAAGIEAYGCANITTGLLAPADIEKMLKGDKGVSERVSGQLNWTTNHKAIFETQYILDMDGNILALDQHLQEKGFQAGDRFYVDKEAIAMLKSMKHPAYSKIYEYGGMSRLSGYAPIFKDNDSSKDIIAISVIDFDGSIVKSRTWDVIQNGLLMGLIPMTAASFLTVFLIRRRTKPISALIQRARQVAEGNLSLEPLAVSSKDEVADLAHTIHIMTENLREMIAALQRTSASLNENAHNTSTSLQEMNIAIQQVSQSMEEVAAETESGTVHAGEAAQALGSLAQLIDRAMEKTNQSVQAAGTTTAAADQGMEKVHETISKMAQIRTSAAETEQTVQELNRYATEIQSITGTIARIASQTNLLALNASIEAARAGEHGKGFAVVADEVRKLAEQSNAEVQEVEKLVGKISDSIRNTVQSLAASLQSVAQGERTVQETGTALQDIRQAIRQTVQDIQDIAGLTREEADTSSRLVSLVHDLSEAIHHMSANAEEVSAAAVETSASIEEVAGSSQETSSLAQELNRIIKRFTL